MSQFFIYLGSMFVNSNYFSYFVMRIFEKCSIYSKNVKTLIFIWFLYNQNYRIFKKFFRLVNIFNYKYCKSKTFKKKFLFNFLQDLKWKIYVTIFTKSVIKIVYIHINYTGRVWWFRTSHILPILSCISWKITNIKIFSVILAKMA